MKIKKRISRLKKSREINSKKQENVEEENEH